ncbi:hypothetical protein GR212_10560 [Rhizobium lusitanum]|uniref:DUF6867 domain-containing protein n=1 Tax=Rhizobium lusitanum TaxID=293958 RepID=A0A6L9U681_9HYPH|nr:hypothetical protein [Rhizobium lusitanum]NEI70012.1 hypothetical protein [Rhizobium lusitanum]
MQGLFFDSDTGGRIVIRAIIVILGFWTAWRAGRAVASNWESYPLVVIYCFLIGLGLQFLHHALFDGAVFDPVIYVIDVVLLLVFGTAGYRYRRTDQMVNNYYWLYEKTSAFSWKKKN